MERERLRLASEMVGTPSGRPPTRAPDHRVLSVGTNRRGAALARGNWRDCGTIGDRAEPRRNLRTVTFISDSGALVPL